MIPGNVSCFGSRVFEEFVPCVKKSHTSFWVTLVLSIFFGWLGVDRCYLGYYWMGFLKFISFSGFGLWGLFDLIMLITGYLGPEDGGSFE